MAGCARYDNCYFPLASVYGASAAHSLPATGGIGLRLSDVPSSEQNDRRDRIYIVEPVHPDRVPLKWSTRCASPSPHYGEGGQHTMKRRRHTPDQIIRKLAEGERLLGQGQDLEAVARHLEVTESTWHRWRNQYGGMKADDAKELRELQRENSRLKKIVADQALDIEMLKEVNRKKY
jgi:putative transposase